MSQFESSSSQSLEGQPRDYRKLYENERDIRQHYEKKSQLMEIKLKKIMLSKNKSSAAMDRCDSRQLTDELKNFKIQIPKTSKMRPSLQARPDATQQQRKYPLISNFAIYGISDSVIRQPEQNENDFFQGEALFASGAPSEIVMHTSKLVFPSGAYLQKFYGTEARNKAVEIMSSNYNIAKSFILSFEPPEGQSFYCGGRKSKTGQIGQALLGMLNSQKRTYAVCFAIPQYTWIENSVENISLSLQNTDEQNNFKNRNMKSVSCTDTDATMNLDEDLCLGISERVYCFFTYYPVFSFFEQIIKTLINLVKMERLVLYREGENLCQTDSGFHLRRMKELFYTCVERVGSKTSLEFNLVYEINFINLQKTCLDTSLEQIKKRYISQWICPILKLFTVDKFLEVFTLIILQEKVVFVCENPHILTYMVYLFTCLLPKPFIYPYPVVNMIPDEQEYLNAPFPVTYGYLKDKKSVIQANLHTIFKNVYVFVTNQGVEIVSADSKKAVINKRPWKLKQKLAPLFDRLHSDMVWGLRRHSKLQHLEQEGFDLTCSKKSYEASMSILREVEQYMETEIRDNIPRREELEKIRSELSKDLSADQDITHQVYKQMVSVYQQRNKDPFFQQFLHTQLLNVHIFQ